MPETPRLSLPLLEPAQAQKHVTVNEAMIRLDALTQIVLEEVGTLSAPGSPAEGAFYAIGAGAAGAWLGQDRRLALFVNNGWAFVSPGIGWRAWNASAGAAVTFDGQDWVEGLGSVSLNGAGIAHRTIEIDHDVAAGATSVVAGAIPADAIVYGVTGRVLAAIGGVASFEIGVSGSTNRYGSGFGTAQGAWTRGVTASPLAYYEGADLVLTAGGGAFDGTGSVRIAIHAAELTLPRG